MDGLVRLHAEAAVLLGRTDLILSRHGAPATHRLWPLLRRRGLLPGDAVAQIVAWTPDHLTGRATLLRRQHERCADVDDLLGGPTRWEGAAGAAFSARLGAARVSHDLFASGGSFLADYLEELADWVARGRMSLAHRLACVITSAEAVTLTVGVSATAGASFTAGASAGVSAMADAFATAAAEIGAELLAEADHFWAGAVEISDGWSSRLDLVAEASAPGVMPRPGATVDVEL